MKITVQVELRWFGVSIKKVFNSKVYIHPYQDSRGRVRRPEEWIGTWFSMTYQYLSNIILCRVFIKKRRYPRLKKTSVRIHGKDSHRDGWFLVGDRTKEYSIYSQLTKHEIFNLLCYIQKKHRPKKRSWNTNTMCT